MDLLLTCLHFVVMKGFMSEQMSSWTNTNTILCGVKWIVTNLNILLAIIFMCLTDNRKKYLWLATKLNAVKTLMLFTDH